MINMQKFTILALSCAILGATAFAQDYAQKVSFTSSTLRVPEALKQLSEKTQTKLLPSPVYSNEVLFIRLQDATLSEALAKIADAIGGEWVKEGDALRLRRSESKAREEAQTEAQQRAALYRKSIQGMMEAVNKTPKYGEAEAKAAMGNMEKAFSNMQSGQTAGGRGRNPMSALSDFAMGLPGNRAIARLLAGIDPLVLGNMPAGSRMVFSNRPTRMQKPIAGNALAIGQTYLQEQKAFTSAQQAASPDGSSDTMIGGGGGMMIRTRDTGNGPMGMPAQVTGNPFKVLLIAQRMGQSDSITVFFTLYNEAGESMGNGFSALSPAFVEKTPSTIKIPENEKPIELTPLSNEFRKMLKSGGVGMGQNMIMSFAGGGNQMMTFTAALPAGGTPEEKAKISAEWLQRILNPETNDPLQWVPNDIFTGIATGLNKNMVVQVPDRSVVEISQSLIDEMPKPTDAFIKMSQDWNFTVKDENGWIVARPSRPLTEALSRVNRPGLGEMLRTLNKSGRLSLDELAKYIVSQPISNSIFSFSMPYARLINANFADRELMRYAMGDDLMIRFYGLLTSNQRQALASGQRLPIQSLTVDQKAIVSRMVFDSQEGPSYRDPNQPRNQRGPGGGQRGGGMMMMMGGGGSLFSERTEFLANGLPMDGFVNVRMDKQEAVLASGTGTGAQMMTPDRLAWTKVIAGQPQMAQFMGNQNFSQFQPVTQVDYNFNFIFTPNVSMSRSLEDAIIDPKSKPGAYDQLSDAFKKKVDAEAKKAQEQMKNMGERGFPGGGGGGRGQNPPAL